MFLVKPEVELKNQNLHTLSWILSKHVVLKFLRNIEQSLRYVDSTLGQTDRQTDRHGHFIYLDTVFNTILVYIVYDFLKHYIKVF